MRTRVFALLLMLVCAAAIAAEPPRVTAGALPDWWPKGEFAYESTMVMEDYGEAKFRTGPREQDRASERGRHWHAYLVRTAPEIKEKAVDTNAKWARLKSALESKGFRVTYLFDEPKSSWIHATLRRGDGDSATWVAVDLSRPFNTGTMEAVEVAPNPFSIELKPPAATPASFTDKENFAYLAPPAGARLTSTEHWKHPLSFATGKKNERLLVGSGYATKTYTPDRTISRIAFRDAYVTALQKAGWTVTPNPDPAASVDAYYDKNGRNIYAHLSTESFDVADVGLELATALANNCKASVYGINFDFDKATLRPDSTPTLEQVLKVLKDDPKLNVEVGGHTDNVGKPDYNLGLSDRRAAAVKEWLVAHGIAASRLSSHGYGDTQPLVKNDSEEHRAENRRVELKKPGCK